MGSHADYHFRSESEYLRLMEMARDMDRNDDLIGQGINRAVTNTIQDGMTLDVDTGDKALDADLQARWEAWSTDPRLCDVACRKTFHKMEKLALRHVFVDGDVFALPTDEGAIELVEAHRVRTPSRTQRNVVHGVLLDGRRKPLQYWMTREDVDPLRTLSLVRDIQAYEAWDGEGFWNVFHVLNEQRVSQTRGVTALAPVFTTAEKFHDINFAKLVQSQVASCFALLRTLPAGEESFDMATLGSQETETRTDGTARLIEQIGPGMEWVGEPGEQLQGFSPNVPNQEFFPHVKLMLTLIAVNLGLPLQVFLLDPSETNFSGWRGAIDQARLGWKENQKNLIERFHRPAYVWKVRQWMSEDRAIARASATAGITIFGHAWKAPSWPYIEPLKDASAHLLRQRNALASARRIQAEQGRTWEVEARHIVEDNVYAIRLAKEAAKLMNLEYPDDEPVSWRELISLPTPDGVTVTLGDNGQGTTDKGQRGGGEES